MMELIGCSYEEATHVRANNNIFEIMNTSGSEFVIDVNCRRTVLEHSVALRLGFVFMKEAPKHIEIDNIRTLGTQGRTVVVVYDDEFDDENSLKLLSPKDIYMRVASNIELIDLYVGVNQQLIRDNPRE